MTRRTQKSSRQRKRQYTRRGGARHNGKSVKLVYTLICMMINGVKQCIKGYQNNKDKKYYTEDGTLISGDYVVSKNKKNN